MKKLGISIAIIVCLYPVLFFLWTPMSMIGVKYGQVWLVNLAYRYDDFAHGGWRSQVSSENWALQMRRSNHRFWCDKFEHCHQATAK
ncbi:MAG: hypothetical protein ABJ322_07155 [Marinobacter sp.]|uniref:hypothetical protein n=1 Tax=Marinobacter sp. TaxID=50741 RepID=UPI003297C6E9